MRHGTTTGYISHKCRCQECREAISRHNKAWRLDRLRGVERLVDARPVRDHVERLLAGGMSFRAITLAAGYRSRNSLHEALRRDKVLRRTRDRILAVSAESDNRRDRYVDATGSRRRLQALAVLGWSAREIAARLGRLDHQTYLNVQSGRTTVVRQHTVDDIARLYDDLWDKPGPSKRARTIALGKGWVPPLAWDDDAIDDPAATPHGAGYRERARSLHGETVEDFLDTWDHHHGDCRLAADRLGVSHEALVMQLRRARQAGMDIEFTASLNRKAVA